MSSRAAWRSLGGAVGPRRSPAGVRMASVQGGNPLRREACDGTAKASVSAVQQRQGRKKRLPGRDPDGSVDRREARRSRSVSWAADRSPSTSCRCGTNGRRAEAAVMRYGCRRGSSLRREHRAVVGVLVRPGSGLSGSTSSRVRTQRTPCPPPGCNMPGPRDRRKLTFPMAWRPRSLDGRGRSTLGSVVWRAEEGSAAVNSMQGRELEPPSRWRAVRPCEVVPRRWGEGEEGPTSQAKTCGVAVEWSNTPRSHR